MLEVIYTLPPILGWSLVGALAMVCIWGIANIVVCLMERWEK